MQVSRALSQAYNAVELKAKEVVQLNQLNVITLVDDMQVSRALSQAYDAVELKAKEVDGSKNAKEAMDALRKTMQELAQPQPGGQEEGAQQGVLNGGVLCLCVCACVHASCSKTKRHEMCRFFICSYAVQFGSN